MFFPMFKFAYPVLCFDLSEITEKKYVAKQCSWPSGGLTLPKLLKNEGGKPRCSKKKTVQHKDLKLV